jgi:hypothetical protein
MREHKFDRSRGDSASEARRYHERWGLDMAAPTAESVRDIVQTGVLVFSPLHHRKLLEGIYFE